MARKGWYEALASALEKEDTAVIQLATIDADKPRVRSLIHRAFLTASTLPTLPLILSTTDIRTPKVAQLAASSNDVVEAVYWTPSTQEQFRILGRASIVPAPGYKGGTYPARRGVVCDALDEEGFDWEAKRVETFDRMSGHLKAAWCRPVPGTPLAGGEEEMKRWPERLPKLGEARNGEERRWLEVALGNFALVLIEPFEVDYLELGGPLDRRTRFERDWRDERSVEFKETLVVP